MLVQNNSLVLALNGGNMALYRNLGKALHVELELLEETRQHVPETADLGRDRPGRSFESVGARRSGYEAPDLHSREEEQFIKRSVGRLADLATANGNPVIVLAPPDALGIARKCYSPALRKLIADEIDRDYSGRSATDVAAFLAAY
ncbi:MAG: host attachment protein, partial [Sphingomonas sp.]